jgi:hypothetical protein
MKKLKTALVAIICLFAINEIVAQAQAPDKNPKYYNHILDLITNLLKAYPQPCFSNIRFGTRIIEAIKTRKLAVIILEPDANMIKYLKDDPALLKAYKSGIARTNQNMKEAINKFWTKGKGIEFKTASEMDSVANRSDYIVAFFYSKATPDLFAFQVPIYKNSLVYFKNQLIQDSTVNRDLDLCGTQLGIMLPDYGSVLFFSQFMADIYPTKTDIAMAIHVDMNPYTAISPHSFDPKKIKNKEMRPYELDTLYMVDRAAGELVKNKTLLVRKDWINDKKLAAADIKKFYPYPYKLVSSDELDEAVMAADSQYVFAYLQSYYFLDHNYGFQFNIYSYQLAERFCNIFKSIVNCKDLTFVTTEDAYNPKRTTNWNFSFLEENFTHWLDPTKCINIIDTK